MSVFDRTSTGLPGRIIAGRTGLDVSARSVLPCPLGFLTILEFPTIVVFLTIVGNPIGNPYVNLYRDVILAPQARKFSRLRRHYTHVLHAYR